LVKSLESRQSALSREDYTMQMRLLRVAYSTLSSPASRGSYDAHLAIRNDTTTPGSALQVMPSAGAGSAQIMRADALTMRAEAIALRADALGLRADLLSGQMQKPADSPIGQAVARVLLYFKTALFTLGTLAAVWMVFKLIMLLMLNREPDIPSAERIQKAEKVFLQEYYQTHGVRPASRAEAKLMDEERRKKEEARRAQQQIEDSERNAARAQQRFEEESRRRGEQVASELRYAEERARQAQLQEEREKAAEKRAQEEAERERIEALRAKWRDEISQ
jgi:hypothetical protein